MATPGRARDPFDFPNPPRYYPDGILQPDPDISPELAFVRAHPFTVQRGGIQYPTPKGTIVTTERLTKAQIAHELRVNSELMDTLRARHRDLNRMAQTALPAEPPSSYTMFSVSVRFKMRGKRYQFLILRTPGGYFTTGGKPERSYFTTWEKLCQWLEGPEVYDHSDIEILRSANSAVSFTSGDVQRLDPAGQPPY